MLKTFPYSAIVNGKIIPPNTPVEIEEKIVENKVEQIDEPKTEEKKTKKKAGVKNDEGTSSES